MKRYTRYNKLIKHRKNIKKTNIKKTQVAGGWFTSSKPKIETVNVNTRLKNITKAVQDNIFKERIAMQNNNNKQIQTFADNILILAPELKEPVQKIKNLSLKKTNDYTNFSNNNKIQYVITQKERKLIVTLAMEQKKSYGEKYAYKYTNESNLISEIKNKFYEQSGDNKKRLQTTQSPSPYTLSRSHW